MNTSQAKIPIVEIGEYVFSVGSTGDSPVPSGDPPDGIGRGIERNGAVLSQPHVTAIPPGGSPGGAGGSPAPPTLNGYIASEISGNANGSTVQRWNGSTAYENESHSSETETRRARRWDLADPA